MTDYFITTRELMETLKVKSKTTFWRMRKRGDVPQPAIRNPLRWRKSEIETFYQNRFHGTKQTALNTKALRIKRASAF